MFLDDLGGDGEAEAGAALLGGEVWEEEALAHLVGKAGAGVGDGEFDHAVFEEVSGDAELAEEALLHGLGGVVDEIAEGALEGFGVGHDERQIGCHLADDLDGLHAAGEEGQRIFDDGVEVGGPGPRGGELGEGGELVDERAHALDRRGDDFAAAADDRDRRRFGGAGRCAICQIIGKTVDVAVNLLCAEADGGERILDLVGYAAGNLFPGGLLLCAKQFGGVFEDENIALVLATEALGGSGHLEQSDGGEKVHGPPNCR